MACEIIASDEKMCFVDTYQTTWYGQGWNENEEFGRGLPNVHRFYMMSMMSLHVCICHISQKTNDLGHLMQHQVQ